MTAKEKAIELYDKYQSVYMPYYIPVHHIKQGVLIAIEEIINVLQGNHIFNAYQIDFWNEVKQEIIKS